MKQSESQVRWLHVVVYYLIACAISWPFFWWRDILHWEGFRGPGFLRTASIMWGPGISAIICLLLFRKTHKRTITFFGTDTVKSLIFWFAPLILLAILGVKDETGKTSHVFPLMLSVFAIFTVVGEELGWRGFLQDAVRPMKPVYRYMLIGIMCELWHFTNRTHDRTVLQAVTIVSIWAVTTIILSWIIGMAVEQSKSVVVASAIHGWVNLVFEASELHTYICAGFAIVLWIWLLKTWNKPFLRLKPST